MAFFAKWACWLLSARPAPRPAKRTQRIRYRPTLECLETRNLLSTLVVTNISDTGVKGDGSLRGEIAAARNGDQIIFDASLIGKAIVLNGSNGPLNLSKDLRIQGLGAGNLTIDGNNATRVFTVGAKATDLITDLTLTNGSADFDFGGAIYNSGNLTIDHCTLSGNHANGDPIFPDTPGGGGAIYNAGTLSLLFSTLSGNHVDNILVGGGGAIYNDFGAKLSIDGCTLSGNSAEFAGQGGGGAIVNFGSGFSLSNQKDGVVTIKNSVLTDNSCAAFYGAAISNFGQLKVLHCTLSENDTQFSYFCAGGISNIGGTLTVDDSIVSRNYTVFPAGGAAGGIINLGTMIIRHSVVSDNRVDLGSDVAGGIYTDGNATIEDTTISGNDNTYGTAGGVKILGGMLTLTRCSLYDNRTDEAGNALGAGAIYNFPDGTVRMDHCSLWGNHADSSGYGLDGAAGGGGAIINTGIMDIHDSTLVGNHADGSLIGGGGGAIYNFGIMTIENSTLSCNHANGGTSLAAPIGGGAIYNGGTLTIRHCTISGNQAEGALGGGILNLAGATLVIVDSTICGNVAMLGADLYNLGTVTLKHSYVCFYVGL